MSVAGVTLVMVFVIQHTQSREQTATQLKLDELIRALPKADGDLVHVEAGQDEELADLERRQTAHHQSLRTGTAEPDALLAVTPAAPPSRRTWPPTDPMSVER